MRFASATADGVGRFFGNGKTERFKMQPSMNKDFLWGVASSGYQCEGGYNGPGQPQNNWTPRRGQGARDAHRIGGDFWNRYEEDFARCHAMGLNAFRLSIEWARVQPSASPNARSLPHSISAFLTATPTGLRHAAGRVSSLSSLCSTLRIRPGFGVDAWLDDRHARAFRAVRFHNGQAHQSPSIG